MPLADSPLEDSPLVRAVWRDAGLPAGVDAAIHPADEMLAFLLAARGGDRDLALADYYLSGFQLAATYRQLLDWWFGGTARVERALDFASGYGRVTRFLVRELAADRLTVADIYAEGVRFQIERFGVDGLVSSTDPAAFRPPGGFDAILVTSLFTHLPEASFHGWLAALWRLLAPGGLLVFSVHDETLVTPPAALPPGGLLFAELSESGSLHKGEYGTAWVSEAFVRRAVARVAPRAALYRLPRALQHFQDLYVATNGAGDRPPRGGPRLRREPLACIEELTLAAPDRLLATGWVGSAPDAGEGAVAAVEALVDGEVAARSTALGPRPDVDAAELGEPIAGRSLRLEIPLPPGVSRSTAVLALRAVDRGGRAWLLAASSIDAALLASTRRALARTETDLARTGADLAARLAAAEAEAASFAARLAAMEASRFWRLRRRWFALKRLLRLTDER